MENDLLTLLLRVSCVSTLTMVLVMAMRSPLRRLFGSGVAYAAWLAVPLCTLSALLPAGPEQMLSAPLVSVVRPLAQALGSAANPAPGWSSWAWVAVWLSGVVGMGALQWRQQRRFVLGLGALQREPGFARSGSPLAGPALVGLLHPTIVVPADFEQRYTDAERSLILAHERRHASRGDPLANLGCSFLLCLFWFNPLAWFAAHLVRLDQEFACDADVVRAHPGLLREYASAMLKTQMAGSGAALACQWQSIHPVKERIMHLNRQPSRIVRIGGRALLAATIAGASYAAWAVPGAPSGATSYDMVLDLNMDGVRSTPTLRMAAGEKAAVGMGEGAQQWRVSFIVNPAPENKLFIKMTLAQGGKTLSEPAVLVKQGEQAELKFALANKVDVTMRMKVSPTAGPAPTE